MNKNLWKVVLVGCYILLFLSCEKGIWELKRLNPSDVYYEGQAIKPKDTLATITTSNVIEIGTTTAKSGGNISNDGGSSIVKRGVCWSKTSNPTITDQTTDDGNSTGLFTSSLTALQSNTVYYLRAYATNSKGTSYGNEISFKTTESGSLATITTVSISAIGKNSATSGGNITSAGSSQVTSRGICWNINTNPTTVNSKTVDGSGTGSFSSSLTSLNPNTKYYVRAYAISSAGTAYGDELSFTTTSDGQLPTLTTTEVTAISGNTAVSGGNISNVGSADVTSRGVCWSTNINPTIADAKVVSGSGPGQYTSNLQSLQPNTTYFVRAYATNTAGTSYGNELSFKTTADGTLATVKTTPVTGLTFNSAVSGGEITADGGTAISARGVCWGTSAAPTISGFKTSNGTGTGVFVSNLTGLSPNSTYFLRSYATNAAGTSYGDEISFKTSINPVLPTLSTTTLSNIQTTGVTASGNVQNDGGAPIIDRGFCWGTTTNPTILNSKVSSGTGIGAFTASIQNLSPATKYYVRAYATNSVGTQYSTEISFTTDKIITNRFNAIQFVSNEIGFIAGNGILLKTIDGGLKWTVLNEAFDRNYTAIKFIDANVGYVSYNLGILTYIAKTQDGGLTWNSSSGFIGPSNNSASVNDFFISADRTKVIAIGSQAITFTSDGGSTWRNYSTGNLPTPLINITGATLYSETIYCSARLTNNNSVFKVDYFLDGIVDKVTVVGQNQPVTAQDIQFGFTYGYGISSNGSILKTSNLGKDWSAIPISGFQSELFNSLLFTSNEVGYIGTNAGKLLKTTNGGQDWVLAYSSANSINDIEHSPNGTIWVVGDNGLIQKF
jgi:photosystem II stability/assembly factor-like uncharacterized protein